MIFKKLILIFALIFSFTNVFAMSKYQEENIMIAYKIGKKIKAKNGMTFENTLAAIIFRESSAGRAKIGDDGKSFGAFQISLPTAKRIIIDTKFLKKYFSSLLNDDISLKRMLKNNIELSALLAGFYLKYNYDKNLKCGSKRAYFRAISLYNGGYNNKKYFRKIMKDMKIVKKIIRRRNEKR